MSTPFKMRGFPMHSTASVLKQTIQSATASTGISDPPADDATATTTTTTTDTPTDEKTEKI